MLVKEHKRKCISYSDQWDVQNIVKAGQCYCTYFKANIDLKLKRTPKVSFQWGEKSENIWCRKWLFIPVWLSTECLFVQDIIINYTFSPKAVYCKNLFSELYVVASTRRRKAKKTDILPFRYREKHLLVVGDAILEALPLSHLFSGLIHPSTFQKPVTMAGKKAFRNIHVLLLFNWCVGWLSSKDFFLVSLCPSSCTAVRGCPHHVPAACNTMLQHSCRRLWVPLLYIAVTDSRKED